MRRLGDTKLVRVKAICRVSQVAESAIDSVTAGDGSKETGAVKVHSGWWRNNSQNN